jgi:transglutaminase-like putative cysteine protease
MQNYLGESEYIDWKHPLIQARAAELAANCADDEAVARRCFEFVRDGIKHSWDHHLNPVTCKASDVLRHGTGFCFAKSHLLAALLRAHAIPAGLCYQRIKAPVEGAHYYLHGLTAIHLKRHGWYRVDARGNKPGVSADFCPPQEKLPYPTQKGRVWTFPEIWPEPLPMVARVLTQSKTIEEVFYNLPDVEVAGTSGEM